MPDPVKVQEGNISTDDLCMMIGEREVKLFVARQRERAIREGVQKSIEDASKSQADAIAATVAKRTSALQSDMEKQAAHCTKMRGMLDESREFRTTLEAELEKQTRLTAKLERKIKRQASKLR